MDDAVDVLIPTYERPAALAVTLTAILGQTHRPRRVVVSDQSERSLAAECAEVKTILGLLREQGVEVELHHHLPRRGMAEQRAFLLAQARAPLALFLDDDVVLDPGVLARLVEALRHHGCGFAGAGLIGLSHEADVRPHEQVLELWEGRVVPERISPDSPAWDRHLLHNAANLLHVERRLGLAPGAWLAYKVAWVGGCVLYDTVKLRSVGGFDFWDQLPVHHVGEDVLAQQRVMARWGGCGVLPSGAYHQELPTTLPRRDVDAPEVLDIERPTAPGRRRNYVGPPGRRGMAAP